MSGHDLNLWADDGLVATLRHEPMDDAWTLTYADTWIKRSESFALSPALPMSLPASPQASASIRRFLENLLPEGRALDITASTYRLSKANLFGLVNALGAETAGAFRFWPAEQTLPDMLAAPPREVTVAELDERLTARDTVPFVVWDGKVRMSIAGYQDKLQVYLDAPLNAGGRLYLVEPPLASTHILKPEPERKDTPPLVVNEHYCMKLAARMGLPVAQVEILRTPKPVLIVQRFDRELIHGRNEASVRRLHIIDTCQACDLPAGFKYERNLGNGEHVSHIREGVSFEKLFRCVDLTINKAAARLVLLRWAMFQFLIGNSDAHGKNFSFFVHRQGLRPAPWYDLVSVVQYPHLDHELAMAYGDAFTLAEVSPFALADFAKRCGIDRGLLKREGLRMAKLAHEQAALQADDAVYDAQERTFVTQIGNFVTQQAAHLEALSAKASRIKDEYV